MLLRFPESCLKWQICDSRTLQFKSLIISHLLITLSDHSRRPRRFSNLSASELKRGGGGSEILGLKGKTGPAICFKCKLDSACGRRILGRAASLFAFCCFRASCDLLHPVIVNIISIQRAVDTELKGQRVTAVEEHLKIHLFEDFMNTGDMSFCPGDHGN